GVGAQSGRGYDSSQGGRSSQAAQELADLTSQRNQLEQRLNTLQSQIDTYRQPASKLPPLPDDAITQAYRLKYIKVQDAVASMHSVLGDDGMRLGIDANGNMLLVAGTEKSIRVVA